MKFLANKSLHLAIITPKSISGDKINTIAAYSFLIVVFSIVLELINNFADQAASRDVIQQTNQGKETLMPFLMGSPPNFLAL